MKFTLSECVVHNSHLGLMFKFFTVRFFKEFLVFKEFLGFHISSGGFIFQDGLASLHLRLGSCVLGKIAFGLQAREAASSAAAFGGLAASSLFLVWKRKVRMGAR